MECQKFYGYQNYLENVKRNCIGMVGAGLEAPPGFLTGHGRWKDKQFNKGLAYDNNERKFLGIKGLLPPQVQTEEEQLKFCRLMLHRAYTKFDKYLFLCNLAETNERLFYKLLKVDIKKMLFLISTPCIGFLCRNFSLINIYPKGIFISLRDKGCIYEVLCNWKQSKVKIVVATDGERVWGVGDLGANAMGVQVGKIQTFTCLAGIQPTSCVPIMLDVGTNNRELITDPFYIGIRRARAKGREYMDFIEEFLAAVVRRWGQTCLILFDNISHANSRKILSRYRDTFFIYNDDIQGSVAVIMAGILTALRASGVRFINSHIMLTGSGVTTMGVAHLCQMHYENLGLKPYEAKRHIWLFDNKGLITKDRPDTFLNDLTRPYMKDVPKARQLSLAIRYGKPNILVGIASIANQFNKDVLESFAAVQARPIIFALGNPKRRTECTLKDAYTITKGKCIFASFCRFNEVVYDNVKYHGNAMNRLYLTPGLLLGATTACMTRIGPDTLLAAAKRLSQLTTKKERVAGKIFPDFESIGDCAVEVAAAVMDFAFLKKYTRAPLEPKNKKELIKSLLYDSNYKSAIPEIYLPTPRKRKRSRGQSPDVKKRKRKTMSLSKQKFMAEVKMGANRP